MQQRGEGRVKIGISSKPADAALMLLRSVLDDAYTLVMHSTPFVDANTPVVRPLRVTLKVFAVSCAFTTSTNWPVVSETDENAEAGVCDIMVGELGPVKNPLGKEKVTECWGVASRVVCVVKKRDTMPSVAPGIRNASGMIMDTCCI